MATFYPVEVEYDESDINDFFAENDISTAGELTPALLYELFVELTKEHDLIAEEVERGMHSLLSQISDSIPISTSGKGKDHRGLDGADQSAEEMEIDGGAQSLLEQFDQDFDNVSKAVAGKSKGQQVLLNADQLVADSFALWKDVRARQKGEQETKLAEAGNVVSPVGHIQDNSTVQAAVTGATSQATSTIDADNTRSAEIDKAAGTDSAAATVCSSTFGKDSTSNDNGTQSDHPTNGTSASSPLASAFASSSSSTNANVTHLTNLLKDAIAEFETGEFARSLILLVKATSFTVAQSETAAQQNGRGVPSSDRIDQAQVSNREAFSANKTPGTATGHAAEGASQLVKGDENLIELL
ncbi:Hypothetical predicted protein [Lecanosticta acicola]|uniref:Uncharacterized protein n=1 Tax=Lecanosticta acicola TaxID=111012 RepID=A0AAI8Z573_9PEZI|nr:Hypothetical predicted protein [Lecanosticta acicola]